MLLLLKKVLHFLKRLANPPPLSLAFITRNILKSFFSLFYLRFINKSILIKNFLVDIVLKEGGMLVRLINKSANKTDLNIRFLNICVHRF